MQLDRQDRMQVRTGHCVRYTAMLIGATLMHVACMTHMRIKTAALRWSLSTSICAARSTSVIAQLCHMQFQVAARAPSMLTEVMPLVTPPWQSHGWAAYWR